MSSGYERVDLEGVEFTRSEKSGTPTVYLTEELGLAETRATLRRLPPGQTMPYHRQDRQEELYLLLEGDGSMVIDGERIAASPGTMIRIPPETPRQLFNRSDADCLWVVIGAPPVDHDGTVIGPGPAADE